MGAPATRDGTAATPINAMSPIASEAIDLFSDPRFGVRQAMAYLALWDRDNQLRSGAVLDMGFAPNWDYRGYAPEFPAGNPSTRPRSGTDSAVGPPTVGASFFGQRMWHGNGVVSTLGGVLNNDWGAVGTGGQVARPMLYKAGVAHVCVRNRPRHPHGGQRWGRDHQHQRRLSLHGAVQLRRVPYLQPGATGSLFCTGLTAAMAAATAVICAVPFVGWIACPFLAVGTVAVSTFCYTTLLAGDPRGPMEEGVAYAVAHGVTVVSISGNQQTRDSLGVLCDFLECGRQDVGAWEIVPGVLDGVICVGAADSTTPYANNQYYGDRVDIWAPVGGAFWAPPTPDAVTGPDAASAPTTDSAEPAPPLHS